MAKIEIVPINEDDIITIMGKTMKNTVRGWSVYIDNSLAAIAGVMLYHKHTVAFSEMIEGLDIPKATIWRVALMLKEKMASLGHKHLYATAHPDLSTAPAFLERLGFIKVNDTKEGKVYLWAQK